MTARVHFPAPDEDTARALMDATHQICPYSHATRDDLPLTLQVV